MAISKEEFPFVDASAVFSLFAEQNWAVFLDSGGSHKKPVALHSDSVSARFDVIAVNPRVTMSTKDDERRLATEIIDYQSGQRRLSYESPLELLEEQLAQLEQNPNLAISGTPYLPGAYGYLAYELGAYLENNGGPQQFQNIRNETDKDVANDLPRMLMGIYPQILLFDNHEQTLNLIAFDNLSEAELAVSKTIAQAIRDVDSAKAGYRGLSSLGAWFDRVDDPTRRDSFAAQGKVEEMDREDYARKHRQVEDYLNSGDCYQVNLTKQFSCHAEGNAWASYLSLRAQSPAPYGAFLQLPELTILSNSPESFIELNADRTVSTHPIKGTAPRDHESIENDRRLAQDLLASEKDRAENLMIVDLMRNDLSRVCKSGSVNVPRLFAIESYANVHHLVSTVSGVLDDKVGGREVMAACFPGGSITGAPKIRAMQIIDELEPVARGVYCGSILHWGIADNIRSNIAIRTIVIVDDMAIFAAGGGIVKDSVAAKEYQEIEVKAKMMRAVLSAVKPNRNR